MKKQNTRRTQRSAAKTDRTSVILNLFREAPNNKFSLKHLASASGGASKEGRRETLEILGRLFEEGIVEECAREKYRLTQKHLPHYEGVADMTSSGAVYVRVEGLENDIFVNQRNASNALDGDRVEVAVMHRGRDGKLEGQVTRIVERNRKPYVGVAEGGAHQIFVRADSRRMPMDIYLSKRTCPDIRDGEKVVVRIADWQPGSKSPVGELADCIRRGAKGLLKDVALFDIYTGPGIPEDKKSVAFNLTLRSDERSLTAAEADEDVKSILALLQTELGATLR